MSCKSEKLATATNRIEELLESEQAQFAKETLEGIHAWVEEHKHITPGQLRAINNIEAAANGRSKSSARA